MKTILRFRILVLLASIGTGGLALPGCDILPEGGWTAFTTPDTRNQVPMWGYAQCNDATFTSCGQPAVPGPLLTVPAGDTTLAIHLNNQLPVGTSIVIPGLTTALVPVKTAADSLGRQRMMSFNAVTAVNATGVYSFTGLKPGTYLYHSGTQPQVQVQMGLYGGVTMNAMDPATGVQGQAYSGVPFNSDVVLLFSEIDPALHAAVAGGNYGPGKPVTSTFDYKPKYFLINGESYTGQPRHIGWECERTHADPLPERGDQTPGPDAA